MRRTLRKFKIAGILNKNRTNNQTMWKEPETLTKRR